MNLLEVGRIVREHGIIGAVKIVSYINENFSQFKHVFVGQNKQSANIISVKPLNNDAYTVKLDIIPDIDTAIKYKNESIFIDRDEYEAFKEKLYLSDLINKPVLSTEGEHIGYMVDFDEYGASPILTIKVGITSFQIPFVEGIISFDRTKDAFIIDKQKFEDMKI